MWSSTPDSVLEKGRRPFCERIAGTQHDGFTHRGRCPLAPVAIIARVQAVLGQLGADCPTEEVVNLCSELTWN
jgi:hypothetical protein